MTIEEKAKAYDEALERARGLNADNMLSNEAFEEIFPELAGSEDERMIKDIMDAVESCYTDEYVKPIRTWLEKQKEQKPIEPGCPQFVFDDVLALDYAMDIVYRKGNEQKLYEALKSLHSRLIDAFNNEQQPAEWSEEDERILKGIIGLVDHNQHYDVSNKEMIAWLKSLRPHSHWKSSEEQMEALESAVKLYKDTHFEIHHEKIVSLYEQLKKLM